MHSITFHRMPPHSISFRFMPLHVVSNADWQSGCRGSQEQATHVVPGAVRKKLNNEREGWKMFSVFVRSKCKVPAVTLRLESGPRSLQHDMTRLRERCAESRNTDTRRHLLNNMSALFTPAIQSTVSRGTGTDCRARPGPHGAWRWRGCSFQGLSPSRACVFSLFRGRARGKVHAGVLRLLHDATASPAARPKHTELTSCPRSRSSGLHSSGPRRSAPGSASSLLPRRRPIS